MLALCAAAAPLRVVGRRDRRAAAVGPGARRQSGLRLAVREPARLARSGDAVHGTGPGTRDPPGRRGVTYDALDRWEGRRPAMREPVAVALDVGGTKVAAGLVSADGSVLHEQRE